MESKRKIIVILGPTASGKSEMAVKIAKKIGGEIISSDSRQVYRGLDIGSGKVKGEWRNKIKAQSSKLKTKTQNQKTFIYKNIPHYCLDFVSPKKVFTVVDFKKCAEEALEKIFAKNKTPIIVGGTGLYIQAIVDNIVLPEVKPDWKLRKELEEKTTGEMFEMLKKLDPERAKNIDSKNPRRLIRAIEIAKAIGYVPQLETPRRRLDVARVGIKLPDEILKKNIKKRIKKMLKEGLIAETKKLRKSGLSWKRIYELGFEYKYPALFLQGKTDKDEMLKRMLLENWQYAKRQMTWFKRDKRIRWIKNVKEAEKLLKNF
ncbi:MAG: tRNA (adenosine(37)-N6)-dimethylallyltransferase MiaA [Candidatus Pacebacteria bacterium]|nr:tRNA (adenosine(37)-N6)-dimethylallyltransferase MiaA [Candidatus Paceibacterota bacterium]NUQ57328.1 tRNA (adenosine(37)-N6)-dimethylallyltransferase MiaA [Candidatus Paceibacter sp.]